MRNRWIGFYLVGCALLLAGIVVARNTEVGGTVPMQVAIIGVFALPAALLLPGALRKLVGERLGASVILLRLVATFLVVLCYGFYVLVMWMLE